MDETERKHLLAKRDEIRAQAIDLLRQSGLVVVAQANEHRVHVIGESIEWSYADGKLTYKIDGHDISDLIHQVSLTIKRGNFPFDTLVLRPKPFAVKTEPTDAQSEKKL